MIRFREFLSGLGMVGVAPPANVPVATPAP